VPEEIPLPGPPEPPPDLGTADATPGPPGIGRPGGVVGGVVADPEPAVAQPLPARPRDLAAVRAGIARTLRYPPEARRREWQGRVMIAFVLRADGTVAGLGVRESSGHPILDEAALAAVRDAAPYPPPGMDVLVVVPLSFRLAG